MDALMLLDERGFFDCNSATLRLFGCRTVEEFTKYHPADLSPPTQPDGSPSMEAAMNHIDRAFKTGADSFSWIHKRTDDTTFPADVLLTRMPLKGRNVLQATVRDITQQKEAEGRLKKAEEKHRTLLNAANVLLQSVNTEGNFVFVNAEWKKALGYTDVDLERITIMNVIRKDHLQYCMSVFKQVMNGVSVHDVETVLVAKDGREIAVSGNACPIFKDGEFVSTVAFFVDITERKKNEEKLRESTRRIELMNEKLRVVGSLTRHDVRNKLSAVTGNAYLLKRKLAGDTKALEQLNDMEVAIRLVERIFEFARTYEKLGAEQLAYLDVGKAFVEASSLFSDMKGVKIVNECNGLNVLADSLLRQLFYNLIDNTLKYGEKTGQIRIYSRMSSAGKLEIVYEDDGAGIPDGVRSYLFKEGFTSGRGTGYGLFTIKRICEVYGWTIEETGTHGKGAQFTMTIPATSSVGKANYQTLENSKDQNTLETSMKALNASSSAEQTRSLFNMPDSAADLL